MLTLDLNHLCNHGHNTVGPLKLRGIWLIFFSYVNRNSTQFIYFIYHTFLVKPKYLNVLSAEN